MPGLDPDVTMANAQAVREKPNELIVRGAIHRRGGEPDLDGVTVPAGDFGVLGSWLHMDGQLGGSGFSVFRSWLHIAMNHPRSA